LRNALASAADGDAIDAASVSRAIYLTSGELVVIAASPDLQTWTPLQTNTLGSGPLIFTDPQPALLPSRFFRLHSQPWLQVSSRFNRQPGTNGLTKSKPGGLF